MKPCPRNKRERTRCNRQEICRCSLLVALSLLIAACGSDRGASDHSSLPAPTSVSTLHDRAGRAIVLRGLNVSSSAKDDPLRMPWVRREDLRRMRREWGLNAVRWLIFWDAIEPQPGVFDKEYLERIAQRLDWCAELGIWVVLDMHQDVYGKFAADGTPLGFDGAPAWAARTDGLPHRIVEPWALTYFQPAVRRAFDRFWSEEGAHADLQEHYRQSWQFVAQRFAGHPAVIGYDLMNEPFAGSSAAGMVGPLQIGDPQRSQAFENGVLTRAYQQWIDAIREVDPDTYIFYEPLAFPANHGGATFLGELKDPRRGDRRLVYSPHFYAIVPEAQRFYDPRWTPEMDDWEKERRKDLRHRGDPLVVGEVGLPWDAAGDPLEYLAKFLDRTDELAGGWLYWSYDPGSWGPVHAPGGEETSLVSVLVRPYPMAVDGQVRGYGFSRATRRFWLHYVPRSETGASAEIFIPARRVYPQGFVVRGCPAPCTLSWNEEEQTLRVATRDKQRPHIIEVLPAVQ